MKFLKAAIVAFALAVSACVPANVSAAVVMLRIVQPVTVTSESVSTAATPESSDAIPVNPPSR